jgi:flagellar motor switch protein FliN/FliY
MATNAEEPNQVSGTTNQSTVSDSGDVKLKDVASTHLYDPLKMDILHDVSVTITIEIGRAKIKIKDLLELTKGSVIELDKMAGEPVDVYANGKLIAVGNIIKSNEKYCVKLLSIHNAKDGKLQ